MTKPRLVRKIYGTKNTADRAVKTETDIMSRIKWSG